MTRRAEIEGIWVHPDGNSVALWLRNGSNYLFHRWDWKPRP